MVEENIDEIICGNCSIPIDKVVQVYSLKHYGKALCRKCQGDVQNVSKAVSKPVEAVKSVSNLSIPSEFIVVLQGKEFITHAGLLYVAHGCGLDSLQTELVHSKDDEVGNIVMAVFKSTAVLKGKVFTAYGDATIGNVNSKIKPHLSRMAETRAINRCLRLATNIGMTSADEMVD